jgi:hypothetical protein
MEAHLGRIDALNLSLHALIASRAANPSAAHMDFRRRSPI